MKISIMMSGGLDSYVAYYYAKNLGYEPLPIWIDIGQPYNKKEEAAIDSFEFPVRKIKADLLRKEWDNLPTIDKQIIPARNLLFTIIGSMFSERIWIMALDGEMHGKENDKTKKFFADTTALLTYVLNYFRPETIVETPFEKMSKTEVVRWALANGLTKEQLLKTSTCYHEKKRNCGECGTCFKRWIAMKNNGIDEKYLTPPWLNSYAQETVGSMHLALRDNDYSRFTQKRIIETFGALRLQGISI